MLTLKSKIDRSKLVAYPTLIFASLVIITRTVEIFQEGGHAWGVGEWLINYNGGFVRRGLMGQILLSSANDRNASLAILVCFQFALVGYVSFFVLQFFLQKKFSWWGVAIALNPAGLLAIAWDSNLLIRKEWLGLAILVWLAKKDMAVNTKSRFAILVFLFSASLLSSEVNLAFILPICYLLSRSEYPSDRILKILIIILMSFSALTLILVTKFHGDAEVSRRVCDLVRENGFSVNLNCDGAISALSLSLTDALGHFKSDYPGYFFYFILLFVAFIPIYFSSWYRANRKWTISMFLGVVPLFLVAWDYGRWIFIFVVSISICMAASRVTRPTKYWRWYQAIAFIAFWGVSHGGNPVNNGMISLIGTVLRLLT